MLNCSKCEIIEEHQTADQDVFRRFIIRGTSEASLLGAPILIGKAMDDILLDRCSELARGMSRLCLMEAHDALILLRAAVGHPTIMNVLRAAPCVDHPSLAEFDSLLRSGLTKIVNCELDDLAWIQAGLPIRDGGLGVRSVALLAPSAFLASAAANLELQAGPSFGALNEVIHRALGSAGSSVRSRQEPRWLTSIRLIRRSDGVTMIPWSEGSQLSRLGCHGGGFVGGVTA